MGLFGTHRASEGSVGEVSQMVEHYFKGRGLHPAEQSIAGSEGCGWWLAEGSARVYIFVQDTPAGPVLRITSPLVLVPQENREAFYRHCLVLNSDMSSCALSIHQEVVLVVAQRPTLGLVQEELDALVWHVAYIADLLDDKFVAEFAAIKYGDNG